MATDAGAGGTVAPGDVSAPVVSVLIPVLNEFKFLPLSVPAMLAQDFDEPLEFLFIDGGSSDGTTEGLAELAASDSRIRVLDNPRREVVHALNIGLEAARGELIARMDAHTFYPAEYLRLGVARLRRGDVSWVSGPQIARGIDPGSRFVSALLDSPVGIGGASFRRVPEEEFDSDAGFTGVLPKALLDNLGGWNPEWPVNEDGELAARVLESGGRIVCVPELAADYVPRASIRALARQYWRYGRYRAKTCGTHPASMRRSHVVPPALAVTLLVAALPFRFARLARLACAGYSAAIVVEGVRLARSPDVSNPPRASLALAVMHLAWGFGFISGCLSFGIPARGAISALRGAA